MHYFTTVTLLLILHLLQNNYNNNNNNDETGSRSPCMRPSSDPPKMKNSTQTTRLISTLVQLNVVRSRLIILINEEINEANWMVSNSAKLDRRTKQHTQFGVSASNSSRYMTRTKSWREKNKKKRKKKKIRKKMNASNPL